MAVNLETRATQQHKFKPRDKVIVALPPIKKPSGYIDTRIEDKFNEISNRMFKFNGTEQVISNTFRSARKWLKRAQQ